MYQPPPPLELELLEDALPELEPLVVDEEAAAAPAVEQRLLYQLVMLL